MQRNQSRMTLDLTQGRIEAFNQAHGGGVLTRKDARGYSLFREDNGAPVARLRPQKSGDLVEVLWWSSRERWESIGDFGGVHMPLEEALDYIANDPMDCFWH
jgi:hypothetical protein